MRNHGVIIVVMVVKEGVGAEKSGRDPALLHQWFVK
jgi:hypothetical protein